MSPSLRRRLQVNEELRRRLHQEAQERLKRQGQTGLTRQNRTSEMHECVPTQDAYDATVRALEKHRDRANRAEASLEDLRTRMSALADLWESHDDRPAIHPAAIAVRAVLAGHMDPRDWASQLNAKARKDKG